MTGVIIDGHVEGISEEAEGGAVFEGVVRDRYYDTRHRDGVQQRTLSKRAITDRSEG